MTKISARFSRVFHVAFLLGGVTFLTPAPALAQPAPWATPFQTTQAPEKIAPPQPGFPVVTWDPILIGIAVDNQSTWPQDSGARRLAGRNSPSSVGPTLHYEALRLKPRWTAHLDLGWLQHSTTSTQTDTGISEQLASHLISLGVSARYQLLRWLSPYVRLTGGVGREKLQVGDGATRFHDKHYFGQGSVGGGLFFRTPGLRIAPSLTSLALALMWHLECGYALATSSDFSLHSTPATTSAASIPTHSVPIGHVSRSAPYIRFSIGTAF
jgi:hypothetical protein